MMIEESASWARIGLLAKQLGERLVAANMHVATAESCTGGGIGYAISEVAGSSQWFLGGVMAYADHIKCEQLCVARHLIEQHGAVSEEVVAAMAQGVVSNFSADVGISVSGIAGPGGGTPNKPVGTVCFGWKVGEQLWVRRTHFDGDRETVRLAAMAYSLEFLINHL